MSLNCVHFEKAPGRIEDVLRLICRTESGRQYLDRFLPQQQAGKIRLEAYPSSIVARLREAIGPDQPIGASFTCDGETGVIRFDPASPLGVLAPFILHEIAHSLDPALWACAKAPQTRRRRDQLMLAAETQAFAAQHLFQQELSERYPAYSDFLKKQSERARILVERMLEADVAEHYGLRKPA